MAINTRQFTLLTAMGIPLWSHRSSSKTPDKALTDGSENGLSEKAPSTRLSFELSDINKSTLFKDILLSMEVSENDLEVGEKQINTGFCLWQFSSQAELSFNNKLLITPSLDLLIKNPSLKQQLWQLITKHQLKKPN